MSEAKKLDYFCEPIPWDLRNNEVYGYVRMDLDGKILDWNRGAELLTGFSREEIIGRPIDTLFTPEDIAVKAPEKERQLSLDGTNPTDERWHMKKDGGRFWAVGGVCRIQQEDGTVVGFSKIFSEQTARKKTEDEMRYANAKLSQFAYTAAHDLQQPLRTIYTFTELLFKKSKNLLNEESSGYFRTIRESSQRAYRLVSDLLTYARSTSEAGIIEEVECAAVIQMALANLKAQIDESGTSVGYSSFPRLPGVPTQLMQLFQNLIWNAIKYRKTNETPRIEITAEPQGEHWLFCIRDNGLGVSPADRERIFETFAKAHEDKSGSGLGLAICKSVVEHHGGKIWVEPSPTGGSSFYFTLRA